MKHISDTDAIKRLYEANIRVNAFKATEKTLAADKISNIIMEQASLVLHLRKIVPNKLVSENPDISKIVGEVAKQWVYYTNALNARFNVMGTKLNDATVEKYRKILAEIKQGLPEDAQDVISNEEISNPSSGPCYVATAVYGSYDCPQVWTLRRFRDYTLAESWLGSLFIKIYYSISPTLVHWFGNTSWFKTIWRSLLDKLVNTLNERGVENTPYQDRKF